MAYLGTFVYVFMYSPIICMIYFLVMFAFSNAFFVNVKLKGLSFNGYSGLNPVGQIEYVSNDKNTAGEETFMLLQDAHSIQEYLEGTSTLHLLGKSFHGVIMMENDDEFSRFAADLSDPICLRNHTKLCKVKTSTKRCTWCPSSPVNGSKSECIFGDFKWNARPKIQYGFNLRREAGNEVYNDRPTYYHNELLDIMFECAFDEKLQGKYERGKLYVPFKSKSIQINPYFPYNLTHESKTPNDDSAVVTSRSGCVVCGRALIGKVSAETITKYVEYYKFQRLGGVILYDFGLAEISNPDILQPYLSEGSLRIVSLQKFFKQLYGTQSNVVLLRSMRVGQIWLRYDCLLRARQLGFEWALFADKYEYLSLGIDYIRSMNPSKPSYFLNDYIGDIDTGTTWKSFGVLKMPTDMLECENGQYLMLDDQLNSNYLFDWTTYLGKVSFLHLQVEAPNGAEYFISKKTYNSRMMKWCKNYHVCTGSSGLRSILLRTKINPLAIHKHALSPELELNGEDVDVDKLYIRRYRCVHYGK